MPEIVFQQHIAPERPLPVDNGDNPAALDKQIAVPQIPVDQPRLCHFIQRRQIKL
ncbi:hypothetical protein D3C73_1523420 [compost metagenome]